MPSKKKSSKKSSKSSNKSSKSSSLRLMGGKRSKRSTGGRGSSKRTKKETKTYTRVDGSKSVGRYTGSTPEIAGKNAGKMVIKESDFKTLSTTVTIRQLSYGSGRDKEFTYKVKAVKLPKPLVRKFGKDSITIYYKYEVERVW